MIFFAVFIRKIEPTCEIRAFHLPPFSGRCCIENGRCWRFLCHGSMHYSRISCEGGVEPQYWRIVRMLC